MVIKIIKLFSFVSIFLCTIISSAQTVDIKLKFAKKYAYCNCIYTNNVKLDEKYLSNKFQISDKSSKEFIELGKIKERDSEKIRSFTEKITGGFYLIESPYYSESGDSNTITSTCLEFYESKELDKFIKKLYKK
ncbi:hypothetical protein [Flavobacterium lipolyticum]|uniref:Uncharacterized protein n=1 Tax=Flavobacterium lipolyticum TaxID=2893754 RepID=A0ABS8M722_9FLAO|nr:hypothetical protein [Flavobacterium sp. F-126]MCC9020619.1 hypothetical protein [Flavobacterium sp. F-126]